MGRLKNDLIELYRITPKCIQYGDFVLASRQPSKYYIDAKQITLSYVGIRNIAHQIVNVIQDVNQQVNAIGGMTLGADPIVSACQAIAPFCLDGFIIRKESKGHGTKQRVEGPVGHKHIAVVIEDTTTTGNTLLEAIKVVQEERGCKVVAGITVVDREQGAKDLLAKNGYPFYALLTATELGI